MINAVIKRLTEATLRRFGDTCTSLEVECRGSSVVFDFSVDGANAHLEVDLRGSFTSTKVRSAFVELGMEIEMLQRGRVR